MDFQIDMLLGLVPDAEMEDFYDRQSEGRELRIQECMRDAGFEYELEDYGYSIGPSEATSRLEWAQQYGFGMWTQMDPESGGSVEMEWPNADIVDALSPSEQNAWWGVNGRCSEEASAEADDPYSNPMVQEVLDDFWTEVENDPTVREALADWQECMADAGHPFADQEELSEAVWGDEEMWELQSQFFESEAWLESSPDHAEWQELVDEEIEIAVADATCSPALEEAREDVARELRPEFVAVWQTIDWSLPPGTYDEVTDTYIDGDGTEPDTAEGSEAEESIEETESSSGLDLSDPTETTEA